MYSTEAELESFRQKWREEVSARNRPRAKAAARPSTSGEPSSSGSSARRKSAAPPVPAGSAIDSHEGWQDPEVQPYRDREEQEAGRKPADAGPSTAAVKRAPHSALEHYEEAAERERQGNLGDSVMLYRKAFRLDADVHEAYKKKHFPHSSCSKSKLSSPNPSNAPATVPHTGHHSLHGLSPSLHDMIAGFAGLKVLAEEPPTELSPSPPCPIAAIPEEILVEILLHAAATDVASFVRLAQVCKRLAYIVVTEERIWKRIALGQEFGFMGMHYRYPCSIDGVPLSMFAYGDDDDDFALSVADAEPIDKETSTALIAASLIPTPYPTYRQLFRARPRIRFNGCYISTVNYARPGASSPNSMTWNSPILIVTYYRYLRFYRDGTVISLLTTAEPSDVIHVLHREYLQPSGAKKDHHHHHHTAGPNPPGGGGLLPSAVMKDALRGRWRLSGPPSPAPGPDAEAEPEGTLHVETTGVTPKYMYKMAFSIGSAGRAARNNKLAWKGYWSYNKLTDDWAEFGLKNDRAFYWSRVKSYGTGMAAGV